MNGRIYDPLLGRMLSADVLVPHPKNLQSYNRYSYVRNNPLSLVDPSGFQEAPAEPAEGIDPEEFKELEAENEAEAEGPARFSRPARGPADAEFRNADTPRGPMNISEREFAQIQTEVENLFKNVKGAEPAESENKLDSSKIDTGSDKGRVDPKNSPAARDASGRLRDERGRFITDPDNPPSENKYTTTDRRNDWREEAKNPARNDYSPEDVARMKRGLAPQRINPNTGKPESMERSHEPVPRRDGGKQTVPRWPDEHAAVDPHRQLKKDPPPPPPPPPPKKDDSKKTN